MKLIETIQEKISERNKLFLALDIVFTLATLIFAIWSLWLSYRHFSGERIPTDYSPILTFAMSFSLGLSFAVRVAEMIFSGKRKYFILYIVASVIVLSVAIVELRWIILG